jgi:hypothetical protein
MSSSDLARYAQEHGHIHDKSRGRLSRAVRALRELGPAGIFRLTREYGVSGCSDFVARNVRYIIADKVVRRWDQKHNVDTAGSVQLDSLSVVGPYRNFGNECLCTSPKTFDYMMQSLPNSVAGHTFIDIGAGKSRTLLLASRYDFAKIVGVEFARELVDVSKKNLARFSAPWQRCTDLEIVHADATQYAIPETPLVVFFYNPFSRGVFEVVMRNILTCHAAKKRDCYIVYSSSSHDAIDWARPAILATGQFAELPTSQTPFFWDAIRTVRFTVFKAK